MLASRIIAIGLCSLVVALAIPAQEAPEVSEAEAVPALGASVESIPLSTSIAPPLQPVTAQPEPATAQPEPVTAQPEPGTTQPVPAMTPAPAYDEPSGEISLRYDELFKSEERSIQRQIDVDLIDIEALRDALEAQFGRFQVRLTLEDAVLLALERNPDILVTQYEPLKSAADSLSARGEFDPILGSTINYTETAAIASQQIQLFGGISSLRAFTLQTTTQLSQKLATGTVLSVALALNKEETTFGDYIEEWDGQLALTVTQPILRGFGTKVNRVRIRQAEKAEGIAGEQLRLTVMQTVSEVVKAYWDLVGAVESLAVRQESLSNAERLLKINETRRDIGTAADIEVLQAKAGVATRQSELIVARAAVGVAEDQLKRLIDLRDGELFSQARVIPVDRPVLDEAEKLLPADLERVYEESMLKAVENRPEAFISELNIETAQLEELSARNQMLPQVDLSTTLGTGGRDHKLRETLDGIGNKDTHVFNVTLQGQVPIGNRAARGQHLRATLSVREAEQRRINTLQQLQMGVSIALRNLFTNQNLVESTRQAREFQEVSVVAEEKRMRAGVTTSYQVLLVQQDLTAAQSQEVQAVVDYEKSRVDLRLAEGTLLDELNARLGLALDIPELEEPVGFFDSITPRFPWEDSE
jgi:outer membrane protein TolC